MIRNITKIANWHNEQKPCFVMACAFEKRPAIANKGNEDTLPS
jgi:hypothetical protein